MPRGKAVQQDLFMQWYPIQLTTGASSATLVEAEFATGLSIRGEYAWLIHCVEFHFANMMTMAADFAWNMILSTTNELAVFPDINDKGSICAMTTNVIFTTSGAAFHDQPFTWHSLPPTIIAAPKLSLYWVGSSDQAAAQSKTFFGRIGYTTVPIDSKMYLEIAETFETL